MHVEPAGGRPTPGVDPALVRAWLEGRGFGVTDQHPRAVTLEKGDVEVFLAEQDGQVVEVGLTFTLSPDSPARLADWDALVREMCDAWDLSLADTATGELAGPAEFVRLLTATRQWGEFAANFGWDEGQVGTTA